MIAPATPEGLAQALSALQQGLLLGLPTETVYGLAADACQDDAVAGIFARKGRPSDHPLIVHVADMQALPHFASEVPAFAHALMQAFWPGPLTVILPRRASVAEAAAGGHPSIGLRCPSHPVAQALLRLGATASRPVAGLAAPSANRFGRISPTSASHVQSEFGDDLLVLDGGDCAIGIESTIVDCTRGRPVVLRPGAITSRQIEQACHLPLLDRMAADGRPAPQAPGTLTAHYAPRARLRLLTTEALAAALAQQAHQPGGPIAVYARTAPLSLPARAVYYCMPATSGEVAYELFRILRNFDTMGVETIFVEAPPAGSGWDGVRDRLQRAAASK